jgi:hypothetical protein
VLYQQIHLRPIDLVSQFAHISDLSHHVPQCFVVDILFSALPFILFQLDVALVFVDIQVVLCNLLECLDSINEVSSVEFIFEVPSVGFELGEVVDDGVHI